MSDQTRRSGLLSKAGNLLRKFDNYGESTSFLIKGKDTENSVCGSLVSIIVLLITLSYAVRRFQVMKEF